MSDLRCLGPSGDDACVTVPLRECLVNDRCCRSVATVMDVDESRVVLPFVHDQENVMDELLDIPVSTVSEFNNNHVLKVMDEIVNDDISVLECVVMRQFSRF